MTELLGQLLDGRYRVVRRLGQGGQSETYVAEDTRRPGNPECVVKRLKTIHKDEERLQRARLLFRREAEVLQKKLCCRHEQIPELLAYFEQDEEFFLVQELIRGHPLSQELPPQQPRWTESQVIYLLQDVLGILAFVHQQQVIHRDVKPDNLIRRHRDGKLVLIDFGAVKTCVLDPSLQDMDLTMAIGTLGYMPPEQAQGEPLPASDLYALGMIAIQALTGISPRQLQMDAQGEVFWQDRAEVGERLSTFLSTMVRRSSQQRYRRAEEAAEALTLITRPLTQPAPADPSLDDLKGETLTGTALNLTLPGTPVSNVATEKKPRLWPVAVACVIGVTGIGWGGHHLWKDGQGADQAQSLLLFPVDSSGVQGELNYSFLDMLLAQEEWQAADLETDRSLLRAAGMEQVERLTAEQVAALPCPDLKTIDQLWLHHSQGRFGFSVQMAIWQRYGSHAEGFRQFAEVVGWRQEGRYLEYSQFPFDPNGAPAGLLPFAAITRGEWMMHHRSLDWWLYRDPVYFQALADRLYECQLLDPDLIE